VRVRTCTWPQHHKHQQPANHSQALEEVKLLKVVEVLRRIMEEEIIQVGILDEQEDKPAMQCAR
jgi:hypothetical protein